MVASGFASSRAPCYRSRATLIPSPVLLAGHRRQLTVVGGAAPILSLQHKIGPSQMLPK